MTPEAKVKARIKRALDVGKPNVWYFMPVQTGYARAGIPDFVGIYKGRGFAIEAKAGKGKTTMLQDTELAAITGAGGIALVVREDGADRALALLEQRL